MAEEPTINDLDESLVVVSTDADAAEGHSNAGDLVGELRPGSASSTGVSLKLDVTMVLNSPAEDSKALVQQPEQHLFSMVSANPETAPTIEVPWSQLLALSLAHDDGEQPALTVGRHKECNVRLKDPRVSVHHFSITAKRKSVDEDSELGPITYDCILNDSSSNGTMVNGKVVGRGNTCHLRSGDEVCVLSANMVGVDQAIVWIFRNSTEILARGIAEATELRLIEHVLCPICMLVIYKCVALMPCFHNFCSACYSDWMGCKSDCPVCRQGVRAVIKNRAMDEVIEALLEASPDNRRTPEELQDMDRRDMLKLGRDGNLVHELKPEPRPPAVVVASAQPAPISQRVAASSTAAAPASSAPAASGANTPASSERRPSGTRTTIACSLQ
jgi:hypothetical protein